MTHSILFACPRMLRMARAVADESGAETGNIVWGKFDDGWPNITIPTDVCGKDVAFLASLDRPADVFEQLSVLCAIPHFGARSLTIYLPYFPVGTMDRMDQKRRVVTAKTLARQLSSIPSAHGCLRKIVMFDLHDAHIVHYFGDTIGWETLSAIPLLKKRLEAEADPSTTIVFPDEGAYKRFQHTEKWFDGYPIVVCEKRREEGKISVRIKEGSVNGRRCIIVDDLIMTGRTQRVCADVLSRAGALTVTAYATHAVCPGLYGSKLPLTAWVTDSCPGVETLPVREVFSLAPLIARHITKGVE